MFLTALLGTLGNVQYNYTLFTQEYRLRSAVIAGRGRRVMITHRCVLSIESHHGKILGAA
jgi:hypothetical protein